MITNKINKTKTKVNEFSCANFYTQYILWEFNDSFCVLDYFIEIILYFMYNQ